MSGRAGKRLWRTILAGALMAIFGAIPRPHGLAAQSPEGVGACPAHRVQPTVGINAFSCEGRCSQWRDQDGLWHWRFQTEPLVASVDPDGPGAGVLRRGDLLVSVDGLLITTSEAGDRLAQVRPGEAIELGLRRGARTLRAWVEADTRCRDDDDAWAPPARPMAPVPAEVPAPVAVPEPGSRPVGASAWPRPPEPPEAVAPVAALPPLPPPPAPDALRLGFSFSCRCSLRVDDGRRSWTFAEDPLVENVEWGGPAERAGIRAGDRLVGIDGIRLTEADGGRRFAEMEEGRPVTFDLVRGAERLQVELVPEAREEPTPLAWPSPAATRRAPAAMHDEGDLPGSLRYVGDLGEIDVEVRGGPVTVSEDGDEIVIRTFDAVIRLRRR